MSFSRISEDLHVLATHERASGFHGVYPKRRLWCAREPFTKRYLGSDPTPRQAALRVLAWWRKHYGEDWPQHFRGRAAPAWAVKQRPDGSWSLTLYVKGRPIAIDPPRTPLPDRAAACKYLKRRCRELLGQDAWRYVRRTADGFAPIPLESES